MFDEYEFHDCIIHNMEFITEEWERSFALSIDYIIGGPINDEIPFNFQVTIGTILFRDVQDIMLCTNSYKENYHYNITNPIILKIKKSEVFIKNNINYYEWSVYTVEEEIINIVASEMVFDKFHQSLVVARQHLYTQERKRLISL